MSLMAKYILCSNATVMAAAYLSSSVVADPGETIIVMPADLSVEDSFFSEVKEVGRLSYQVGKAILPEGQAINEQLHTQEGILVVASINQVKSQPKVLYRCTNDFRM